MGRLRPPFAPLKSSSLRGLSGPSSPASPVSPCIPLQFQPLLGPQAKTPNDFMLSKQAATEPPSIPMPWIWSCHRCHTRYLLGATRRCLHDGHYFCGGTTVDKISGKLKKHKACVSEFDYSGWEDFGRWKRATIDGAVSLGDKHCEDLCDFPSSCHWQEHRTIQNSGSACNNQSCLDKEPEASPTKGKQAVPRKTGNRIGKVKKVGEKRATQARAILPPIEEENPKALSFADKRPRLNGLSLHNPVMEFSKIEANEDHQVAENPQTDFPMQGIPQMSARVDSIWDDDDDYMTNCFAQDAPISPCAQPKAIEVPFDFRLNQDQDEVVTALLVDDDSPVSPMGSTWNWTADGIGVALSPPDLLVGDEKWDEEVGEIDDVDIPWDREENMKTERFCDN